MKVARGIPASFNGKISFPHPERERLSGRLMSWFRVRRALLFTPGSLYSGICCLSLSLALHWKTRNCGVIVKSGLGETASNCAQAPGAKVCYRPCFLSAWCRELNIYCESLLFSHLEHRSFTGAFLVTNATQPETSRCAPSSVTSLQQWTVRSMLI